MRDKRLPAETAGDSASCENSWHEAESRAQFLQKPFFANIILERRKRCRTVGAEIKYFWTVFAGNENEWSSLSCLHFHFLGISYVVQIPIRLLQQNYNNTFLHFSEIQSLLFALEEKDKNNKVKQLQRWCREKKSES